MGSVEGVVGKGSQKVEAHQLALRDYVGSCEYFGSFPTSTNSRRTVINLTVQLTLFHSFQFIRDFALFTHRIK